MPWRQERNEHLHDTQELESLVHIEQRNSGLANKVRERVAGQLIEVRVKRIAWGVHSAGNYQ